MHRGERRSQIRTSLAALALPLVLLIAGCLVVACDSHSSGALSPSTSPTSTSVPTQLPKETLTFGVVGSADEVDQYRQMASLFAPLNRPVNVRIQSWPDDAAMMAAFRQGTRVPDVLLASRRDLSWLTERRQARHRPAVARGQLPARHPPGRRRLLGRH